MSSNGWVFPVSRASLLLAGLAGLIAAGLLPGAAQSQDNPLAGCYELELGRWDPPAEFDSDSLYYAPPPRIQLGTVPSERMPYHDPERLAVLPAPGTPPSMHRTAFWRMVGDSIFIVWNTGFAGVSLRLVEERDGLRGDIVAGSHQQDSQPRRAPAFARRVSCSAPAREEWAGYRRFPREVQLESGNSIALREPLPDALRPSEPETTRVRGTPAGLFGGAAGIHVTRNREGIVRSVSLDYPPDTDFDRLVERIAAEYGPPVRRWERSDGVTVIWSGRDTQVTVSQTRPESGSIRITVGLRDPRFWL